MAERIGQRLQPETGSRSVWLIAVLAIVMAGWVLTAAAVAGAPLAGEAAPDSTAVSPEPGALMTVWRFLDDLFDLSARNATEKAMRIAVICAIGLIARFLMAAIQGISRFAVYSEWGPLKYLFRNHQRSITVQALLISLAKYVVYFTALGYTLSELGVNYKTYLASLSLIGIAVGFGSQGLVQDVVTGFFILFENQFSVGDMVEVSGQVGMVEAIGLRTTRIRNYFGASVVLQNRNIPMASRYPCGGFEVGVDVAISGPDQAEGAADLLQQIGAEVEKQFPEIIVVPPRVVGLVELETREFFVRLQARIWPAQQWVVDAQLVPRIREIFKREGIEIPGDRVVSFYHLPEQREQSVGLVRALQQLRKRPIPSAGSKD